jgi:hypothetical protein
MLELVTRLFTIIVTAEGAHHGDGTDEDYTFQAYAPNGEILTFKGTGYTLADAATDFADSVRHVKRGQVVTLPSG